MNLGQHDLAWHRAMHRAKQESPMTPKDSRVYQMTRQQDRERIERKRHDDTLLAVAEAIKEASHADWHDKEGSLIVEGPAWAFAVVALAVMEKAAGPLGGLR